MAPFKSSLAKSAGKFLGIFNQTDLSLRGADQTSRFIQPPLSATGGTILTPGNGYKYHVFSSSGSFEATGGTGICEIFLVGGGGGASDSLAGGGGAGGVVYLQNQVISAGTYTITIGGGGAISDISAPSVANGNPGTATTFSASPSSTLTALGGGRGGAYSATNAGPGGSGGGSGGSTASIGTGLQPSQPQPFASPTATLNQYGNPGSPLNNVGNIGGGGGGAGSGGSPATAPGGNGQPFPGFAAPIISPAIPAPLQPTFISAVGPTGLYGGGGGAGARDGFTAGQGGPGGGGDGYNASPQGSEDGTSHTGGGGVTAGTTKTITNYNGVSTVSSASTTQLWYLNNANFNGTSYHLGVTADNDFNLGTRNWTVECWFYANALGGALYQNGFELSNDNNIQLTTGTYMNYQFFTGGSNVGGNGVIPLSTNKWTHVAYVRNGSTINGYINGVLDRTITNTGSVSSANASYWSPTVGARTNNLRSQILSYFNGYIQDLRVYTDVAKYTTNFTPPPPMFGDYTRSTPNKIVFTPGSDYVLEARNTATGGIVTSTYSATRQWGTKPEGGIYDPYAANLVLAIPGGAQGGITTAFDVTGQIRFETPTSTYSSGQIVTSPSGATYTNKSVTLNGNVANSDTQYKYYGRSLYFDGTGDYVQASTFSAVGTGDYTVEGWVYIPSLPSAYLRIFTTTTGVQGLLDVGISFRVSYTNILTFSSGSNTITYGTLPVAQWIHLAGLRKNGIAYFYVNGVLIGQIASTTNLTETTNWYLGGYFSGNNTEFITGYIQDFRAYYGLAKYTTNFTPPNQIYLT